MSLKLNIGAGCSKTEGYVSIDRKTGQEAYPLSYADSTVEILRSSHCLEHFSRAEVMPVLKEWVRVLKPGGALKIAVPDLRYIARAIVENRSDEPFEAFLFGGQTDQDDFHKCSFTFDSLKRLLESVGLVDIQEWKDEIVDCHTLPVSLNLMGSKPQVKISVPVPIMWHFAVEDAGIYRARAACHQVTGNFHRLTHNPRLVDCMATPCLNAVESAKRAEIDRMPQSECAHPFERRQVLDNSGVGNCGQCGQVIQWGNNGHPATQNAPVVKSEPANNTWRGAEIYHPAQNRVDCEPSAKVVTQITNLTPPILDEKIPKIIAATSVPRLGFTEHWGCVHTALTPLGIEVFKAGGAFWGQGLTRGIQKAIEQGADYILTLDYDTIFTQTHVMRLIQLMTSYAEVDIIISVQVKRENGHSMFVMRGLDGKMKSEAKVHEFNTPLTKIVHGHFGLTLIRASSLAKLSKPWFLAQPNKDGEWEDGRIDEDIYFWKNAEEHGLTVCMANEVRIGHLQNVISWPAADFSPIHQYVGDWYKDGQPKEAGGDLKIEYLTVENVT